MCAWRYKATGAGGAASPSVAFGAPDASGAGAFLRQNAVGRGGVVGANGGAASLFNPPSRLMGGDGAVGYDTSPSRGPHHDQDEDEEEEDMFEEEEEEHDNLQQASRSTVVPPLQLSRSNGFSANGKVTAAAAQAEGDGFGQAQAPVGSLAGAFLRNVAKQHQQQATSGAAAAGSLASRGMTTVTASAAATLRRPLLAGLSRQLFKAADARGRFQEELNAEEDKDEFDDETAEDRDFVLNTRELFQDVDAELLSEQFVPHEHVVGIIANDMGDEATPDEIDDRLAQYNDLMEEIDMHLDGYIEAHHDEFNKAISDFSEMILAVSGSDDTLARLKKELVLGATSLDTHAEQLRVLRLRAAKSLFMKDTLQSIQDALTAEAEIKQLLSTKHYLRAVQQLQKHRRRLQDDAVKQIRSTSGLREFVEATTTTVHTQIIDDLLSCVFRQERLVEADAQLLSRMMGSDGAVGESRAGGLEEARGAAPNVRHMVHKYWKRTSRGRHDRRAAHTGDGGRRHTGGAGGAAGERGARGVDSNESDMGSDNDLSDAEAPADRRAAEGTRKKKKRLHPMAAIVETLYDDTTDDLATKDYLRFIPLCVKSLLLLGKFDSCHAAFFSRATRCIERFIAHFLSLYDAWRRKIISGTTLAGSDGSATVRAIRIRAFDLTNDLVSSEEAIATVQARELRAMLSALFAELEKVVRNADYLVKIVAVARFPFISEFIVQPVPFDAEKTSKLWDLQDVPLGERLHQLEDIVAEAERKVEDGIRRRVAKAADRKRRGADSSSGSDGDEEKGEEANRGGAGPTPRPTDVDEYAIWDHVKDFFSFEKLVSRFAVDAPAPSDTAVGKGGVEKTSPPPSFALSPRQSSSRAAADGAVAAALTLADIAAFIDDAVQRAMLKYGRAAADGSGGYGYKEEQRLQGIHHTLQAEVADGVRMTILQDVKALLQEWDLNVLWAQLNYHVEFVFHVLCDAKEAEDEGDDLVTLAPFLRQKNLVRRVQRTAAILKEAESRATEDAPSLEKLLNTYQSSTGLLRLMEETGTISFSLVGAVKKAQADVRRANEGQVRQYQAMESDTAKLLALSDSRSIPAGGGGGAAAVSGGVGGANAPLVLLNASGLRNWFVFSAMNVLTCYECAERFCHRCGDRVPEFRLLNPDDSVLGFFKRFSRSTYIPALHAFHSQQLQQLCLRMGDTEELVAASLHMATGGGDREGNPPATGEKGGAAASAPASSAAASSHWPTVTISGAAFPVLSCVHYVGQVLEKISAIRAVLPASLAEDVERSTSEALVEELAAFLKRKVQLLGRGTIQFRLLNGPFEDAFASLPNRRWQVLCDEEHMWTAHKLVDLDLYRYYQLSSAQRTSGHEYTRQGEASLEALSALDRDKDAELDEKIGLVPAQDLCVRDDSSIVALAVLSYSAEWLCEVLLRNVWPGARRYDDYTDSCVPGYLFTKQLSIADSPSFFVTDRDIAAQHKVRLSGLLTRLCSLAQVALFYLSVESRFQAFCFVPQLRDESYNIVATSAAADTFVQAFARRIGKLYMLLRQHLSAKKIKFTCLTAGKPASELILMELAHLRDKAISEAGMARLRTDLLVMQTALQLILPMDLDVRSAVSRYFSRPAVFVRYIPNRDVVNELLSSGDFRRFTLAECEELIRLVFRQVTGANDDSMARANIDLFYSKLKAMEGFRKGTGGGATNGRRRGDGNASATATDDEEEEDDEEDEESTEGAASMSSDEAAAPHLSSRGSTPALLPTTLQTVSSARIATRPPPPLPLAQASARAATAPTPAPAPAPAAQAIAPQAQAMPQNAAATNHDGDDEEYEETGEGTEGEEEGAEERVLAPLPPPAQPRKLPDLAARPSVAAATAASATVPPIPIFRKAAASPAPGPAPTAAAVAEEESSDEYYYEEVTDDDEEDEEDETEEEEEEEAPKAARRR